MSKYFSAYIAVQANIIFLTKNPTTFFIQYIALSVEDLNIELKTTNLSPTVNYWVDMIKPGNLLVSPIVPQSIPIPPFSFSGKYLLEIAPFTLK